MKNKVGRDIPDSMFKTVLKGAEVFQGVNYRDGYVYKKASPTVSGYCAYRESKVAGSLKEAIEKTGLKDGMTISFHHHFRDGDYIVNMVMDAVAQMGIKDITICPSSLTDCHDHIVPYIEDGTITGMLTSGLRGKIGEAVSAGKLKKLPGYVRTAAVSVQSNVAISILMWHLSALPHLTCRGTPTVLEENRTVVLFPMQRQMRNTQIRWL